MTAERLDVGDFDRGPDTGLVGSSHRAGDAGKQSRERDAGFADRKGRRGARRVCERHRTDWRWRRYGG